MDAVVYPFPYLAGVDFLIYFITFFFFQSLISRRCEKAVVDSPSVTYFHALSFFSLLCTTLRAVETHHCLPSPTHAPCSDYLIQSSSFFLSSLKAHGAIVILFLSRTHAVFFSVFLILPGSCRHDSFLPDRASAVSTGP